MFEEPTPEQLEIIRRLSREAFGKDSNLIDMTEVDRDKKRDRNRRKRQRKSRK